MLESATPRERAVLEWVLKGIRLARAEEIGGQRAPVTLEEVHATLIRIASRLEYEASRWDFDAGGRRARQDARDAEVVEAAANLVLANMIHRRDIMPILEAFAHKRRSAG